MKVNVRDLYLPDPGYLLAEFDYSQAEARVVAYLSRDDDLKHDFATGVDIHSKLAASLFSVEYEWVVANKKTDKKAKEMRQTGKTVGHAFNYDMGPKALMERYLKEGIVKTFSECKLFLQKMRYIRPCVERWHEEVDEQVRKTRVLRTPLGLRRYFGGLITKEVLRKAYAFVPQSTVGHMTSLAWLRIYQELGDWVDVLMQVHDSLVCQVPESERDWLIPKIAELMTIPLRIHGEELVIPVECKVGYRYGSLKEVELPKAA